MIRKLVVVGLAIFISLVAASSCSNDHSIHCRFDTDTTPHEKALFISQMKPWNDITDPDYIILADDHGDELITFTTDIWAGNVQVDGRECTWEGEDCRFGQWIRVRRGLSDDYTRDIARHELGHALGMHHLRAGQVGTMYGLGPAHEITEADKAMCREVGACDPIMVSTIAEDSGGGPR